MRLGYETPLQTVVRDVASTIGVEVTDDEVSYILWEHTGYPQFWPTGRPVDDCIEQVERFFLLRDHGWRSCVRCGRPAVSAEATCEPCGREMILSYIGGDV